MAGIDDVLERLVTDRAFRERLAADPAGALSGYMLFDEDLEVLATALDQGAGESGAVESRTSKSTLVGLLAALEMPGGGGTNEIRGNDGAGSQQPSGAGSNKVALEDSAGHESESSHPDFMWDPGRRTTDIADASGPRSIGAQTMPPDDWPTDPAG